MENSKQKIVDEIKKLKKEKNAIIFAHNYQLPEVQDIADEVGDSLELSRKAADNSDTDVIVFCGVHFMAETAKILSPDKTVLLPAEDAGCPLANMITKPKLIELKEKHPDAFVLGYVNTSAEVKSELDSCCTSANAKKVVNSVENEKIIFVPDKYLASYVSRFTDKEIISWNGYCPTHIKILPEHILEEKRLHPKAKVIAHPECTPKVIDLADFVESTSGMIRRAKESNAKEFIIGTEREMVYRLTKENPGKIFYPASSEALCPNMKKTNLEKVLFALQEMSYEIIIPEDIRKKAKTAVDRMLEFT